MVGGEGSGAAQSFRIVEVRSQRKCETEHGGFHAGLLSVKQGLINVRPGLEALVAESPDADSSIRD